MAREIFNRGPMQPSVCQPQSKSNLKPPAGAPRSTNPKPQQQQPATPSSATLPKATKATKGLNRAVGVTGVSESNFDPVNFPFLKTVDAPINSMAGGTLEAIGGEMKIAKINVGENAETELNDASMGTKAQKVSMTATKNNGNGVVYDSLPPTNDAALDCLDCPAREECTFGKTGMYKQVLLVLCCQA